VGFSILRLCENTLMTVLDEALLQYSKMCAIPEPDMYNVNQLKGWMQDPYWGDYSTGGNGEQDTWGKLTDTEGHQELSLWRLLWFRIRPPPPIKSDRKDGCVP
jgi:hypothetical protein